MQQTAGKNSNPSQMNQGRLRSIKLQQYKQDERYGNVLGCIALCSYCNLEFGFSAIAKTNFFSRRIFMT